MDKPKPALELGFTETVKVRDSPGDNSQLISDEQSGNCISKPSANVTENSVSVITLPWLVILIWKLAFTPEEISSIRVFSEEIFNHTDGSTSTENSTVWKETSPLGVSDSIITDTVCSSDPIDRVPGNSRPTETNASRFISISKTFPERKPPDQPSGRVPIVKEISRGTFPIL